MPADLPTADGARSGVAALRVEGVATKGAVGPTMFTEADAPRDVHIEPRVNRDGQLPVVQVVAGLAWRLEPSSGAGAATTPQGRARTDSGSLMIGAVTTPVASRAAARCDMLS